MTKSNTVKPILKWVGGKTQILDKIMNEFPTEINNYREIFTGGGSVLLAFLIRVKNQEIKLNGSVYAYDVNKPLIYMYKNIQKNHVELYKEIQNLIEQFGECGDDETVNRKPKNIDEAKLSRENYFYWIRNRYNELDDQESTECSAMFIFLNKTCFRGVYRIGPNGFNVPYGNYKNPEIININHLTEIHELINCVIFECCDFRKSLENVIPGDFVYLDPPYVPEIKTSFVKYTENGFNMEEHTVLFNIIHKIVRQNVNILLTNSFTKIVLDNFSNKNYDTMSVSCKRTINSKNPESKTTELIIKSL